MDSVRIFAMQAYRGNLLIGPVYLCIEFVLARRKDHYGTGRNKGILKPSAPKYHLVQPDLCKLTRSTEDALTGVIWKDDSQVVTHSTTKRYNNGEKTGALISIEELI